MFRIGLNPYGLTYTVGLQGVGTPRANPNPTDLRGFLTLARDLESECVEIDDRWLVALPDSELTRLGEELASEGRAAIISAGLTHEHGETLEAAIRCARHLRAKTIRLGLTPVLEGSRATWGQTWQEMVAHAGRTLIREAPRAADDGITLAIENHQDFGSEELVAMAEASGANVGITLDTGNPFAVGEDPVAFTARAASRVRHVHLKDYRAVFTDEGYRLVRCVIGEGAVPFAEMARVLATYHVRLSASLELAALEARHVRLFTPGWWRGYGPRDAAELGEAMGRLRLNRFADGEPWQTPWEDGATAREIVAYEDAQIRQSMANLRMGIVG